MTTTAEQPKCEECGNELTEEEIKTLDWDYYICYSCAEELYGDD